MDIILQKEIIKKDLFKLLYKFKNNERISREAELITFLNAIENKIKEVV